MATITLRNNVFAVADTVSLYLGAITATADLPFVAVG